MLLSDCVILFRQQQDILVIAEACCSVTVLPFLPCSGSNNINLPGRHAFIMQTRACLGHADQIGVNVKAAVRKYNTLTGMLRLAIKSEQRADLLLSKGFRARAYRKGPCKSSVHLAQVIAYEISHSSTLALVVHFAQFAKGLHLQHGTNVRVTILRLST